MTSSPHWHSAAGSGSTSRGCCSRETASKTLTCLAGTEPVVGAQHPAAQRLQFFLSESTWDHERVNARRVELLRSDPATAPHPGGVLVIDDSGDRKDGKATARIGRQCAMCRFGVSGLCQ
ncbi:transposase [Streptomyces sp. SID12501]|uniref:transposase n=1 Tax=Streptomyces sp. SID12501 TaxID=2706042 RepID=UPI001EF1F10E|nr:transposase [Streptomyces sp. SID12501]